MYVSDIIDKWSHEVRRWFRIIICGGNSRWSFYLDNSVGNIEIK